METTREVDSVLYQIKNSGSRFSDAKLLTDQVLREMQNSNDANIRQMVPMGFNKLNNSDWETIQGKLEGYNRQLKNKYNEDNAKVRDVDYVLKAVERQMENRDKQQDSVKELARRAAKTVNELFYSAGVKIYDKVPQMPTPLAVSQLKEINIDDFYQTLV